MGELWSAVSIAALVTALALVAEHYVPWYQYLTGREMMHPLGNYVAGLLAILLPWTVALLRQSAAVPPVLAVGSLWVVTCAGGLTVGICYAADSWHAWRTRAREAELREIHARKNGLPSQTEEGGRGAGRGETAEP